MRSGERCDRRDHTSKPSHAEEQRGEKQQVIVAAENVFDAEPDKLECRPLRARWRGQIDRELVITCVEHPLAQHTAIA